MRHVLGAALLLVVGAVAGCTSGGGSWEAVAVPVGVAEVARVEAVTTAPDGRWWAVGTVDGPGGGHRPGAWTSPDGRRWSPVPLAPGTPYGAEAELWTVAVDGAGRVVAFGGYPGGVHGNPRLAAWTGDAAGLREVPATFETYGGPRQLSTRSVAAGPAGFVLVGSRVNRNGASGAASWTSPEGSDVVLHDDDPALSSGPGEQVLGADIGSWGGTYVAVGERFHGQGDQVRTDAVAWTSPDGARWSRWDAPGFERPGSAPSRAQRVAAGPDGALLVAGTEQVGGRSGIVAWRRDPAGAWQRVGIAALGRGADPLAAVTSVAAGPTSWVAARVGGRLRLARSHDGTTWSGLALPGGLPTGDRAQAAVHAHAGRVVLAVTGGPGGGLWIRDDF